MKILNPTAIIIATVAILFSCGNADKSNAKEVLVDMKQMEFSKSENELKDKSYYINDSSIAPQNISGENKKGQPIAKVQPPKIDWDKKIIKTANLNFELKEYDPFNNSIREKIKQVGGYIASEEQNQSEYKIENSMTIKVPVDQFDNALAILSAGVQKINEKKITSEDVTTEVVDTRSRLESKKQIRLRYLELLKQAKNMEDILSVQSEINGIQQEIESAAGRVEYLNHSSAFSTINLTFYQILNSSAKDTDQPAFGKKIAEAFKTGWIWVSELFVGMISIWPFLLLVFAAVVLYKRSRIGKIKAA